MHLVAIGTETSIAKLHGVIVARHTSPFTVLHALSSNGALCARGGRQTADEAVTITPGNIMRTALFLVFVVAAGLIGGALATPLTLRPAWWVLYDLDASDPARVKGALSELKRRRDPTTVRELVHRLETSPAYSVEIADALSAMDSLPVAPLTRVLEYGHRPGRSRAAYALGHTRQPEALEPLQAALKSPYAEVRQAAAGALATIPGAEAEKTLTAIMRGKDRELAYWASYSLSRRASVEALPLINKLCDELEASRRTECVKNIGRIGGPKATAMLAARLEREQSPYVRMEIAALLAKAGDAKAGGVR